MNKITPSLSLKKLNFLFALGLVAILGLAIWLGIEVTQSFQAITEINHSVIIAILSLCFVFAMSFYGYYVTKKEIIFRQETQQEIWAIKEEQQLMARAMPVALYRGEWHNKKLTIAWVSEQIKDISTFSPHYFMTDHRFWVSRIHPEDKARVISQLKAVSEKNKVSYEYRWQCADGEYQWFLDQATLIQDPQGQHILVGAWVNIHERKTIEAQLIEQNNIMAHAVEGIAKLDEAGIYVHVNPAYANLHGYFPDDLIGQSWTKTILVEDQKTFETCQRELALRGAGKTELEVRGLRKDMHVFHAHIVMIYTKDEQLGTQGGYYCFMRDISNRKNSELQLKIANEKLTQSIAELEARNAEVVTLSELGELLQTCQNTQEAYDVVQQLGQKLFPHDSGALYIISASRNLVENVSMWGELKSEPVFAPEHCWSLRRGRLHEVLQGQSQLMCHHMSVDGKSKPENMNYICSPLMSHGEIIGLIHLERQIVKQKEDYHLDGEADFASKRRLVLAMSEQLALALANLKLREKLQNQSIRDPLTGLFNRRYMEESLERELSRAKRKNTALAIIMLDVDHFKRFNDTYGHDAGDILLNHLGSYLQSSIRKEDIACRYGGEEFLLIFPDMGKEQTLAKAQELNQNVRHMKIKTAMPIGEVTISVGVALYPIHGQDIQTLVHVADMALYRAKKEGRNRVILGGDVTSQDLEVQVSPVSAHLEN